MLARLKEKKKRKQLRQNEADSKKNITNSDLVDDEAGTVNPADPADASTEQPAEPQEGQEAADRPNFSEKKKLRGS
jgi:hypothetical protein